MINWSKKLMPLILADLLKTNYDAKLKDTEGKILSITGLSTTVVLPDVKSKIHNISDIVNRLWCRNKRHW